MDPNLRYVATAVFLTVSVVSTSAGLAQPTYADSSRARARADSRAADAELDLQGYWTNDTYTPLERPAELAGKEFFTQEEAAAFIQSRTDQLHAQAEDDIHYDDAIWQAENYGKVANLRTSIIVEPRDGKLPPLTPQGEPSPTAEGHAARDRGVGQRAKPLARRALHLVGQRRAADDAAHVQREHARHPGTRRRDHPPRDDA